jgi:hypothetical protein
MNAGKLLFAQLMDLVPRTSFARRAARQGGDCRLYCLTCTEPHRATAFAQLAYRAGLRDIEACLNTQPNKLHAMGFRAPLRRSTSLNSRNVFVLNLRPP